MDIRISQLSKSQGSRWQVSFDGHNVTFRSEAEARNFASTLRARLQAPRDDMPSDEQPPQTKTSDR